MRRITLALALMGAVAATGCGQTTTSDTGGNRGVAENTFTITVQNGQGGNTALAIQNGYVTSSPAGIDCGIAPHATCSADFPATAIVTLTVNPVGTYVVSAGPPEVTAPYQFLGWAGDCIGTGTCAVTGPADRYLLARFGTQADIVYHGAWSDPATHAPQYLGLIATPPTQTTWNCLYCHGATLAGQGIALSCQNCHYTGVPNVGGHENHAAHNTGSSCPRCHAGGGFRDYIGADGSPANYLNGYGLAAGTGYTSAEALNASTFATGIKCDACHNAVTVLGELGLGTPKGSLSQIAFPSYSGAGKLVTPDDKITAICGQCHTGVRDNDRNIASVGSRIAAGGGTTLVDALLTGTNRAVRPHYLSAASTLLGEEAAVYSQIAGMNYTARNQHGGASACSFCHDPHTGSLPFSNIAGKCGGCHFNDAGASVTSYIELEEVRQFGFEGDIDGDANATESLKAEIEGLKAKLVTALQAYGTAVGGANMCFKLDSSNGLADQPYVQVNTTDACGDSLGANGVAYNRFTSRSLRAAFNYMAIQNDPGAWAHNPRYVIEILYDSIADLNQGLGATGNATAIVPNGNRAFNGHFGGAPKRYATMLYHGGTNAYTSELIPNTGFTSGDCYQCHGGSAGYAAYLTSAPVALTASVIDATTKVTALQCSVCHALDSVDMKGLRTVGTVYFPPQRNPAAVPSLGVVSFDAANLPNSFAVCGTCHSGRENGTTIVNKIGVKLPGDFSLTSTNPHYLGAAGVMLGDDAKVLFQYPGKTYTKNPVFWAAGTAGNAPGPHGSPHGAQCVGCHKPKDSKHEFGVDFTYCATCHAGPYALAPIEEEYVVRKAELFSAMQSYVTANLAAAQAAVVAGYASGTATQQADAAAMTNICFNGGAYPYWYVYTTTCSTTGFSKFDPKLLKASFNYMWTQKEPGAWAHNEFYVFEAMYDSIEDLGSNPTFIVGSPAVTFANVTQTTVTVNWTTPRGVGMTYKVERAPESATTPGRAGTYVELASGLSALTYDDVGPLTAATRYFYRVTASNATPSSSAGSANVTTAP